MVSFTRAVINLIFVKLLFVFFQMASVLRNTLYLQHRSTCHFFLGSPARISRHLSASVHVTQRVIQLLLSKPSALPIVTRGRNFSIKHLIYHSPCSMISLCAFILVTYSGIHSTGCNCNASVCPALHCAYMVPSSRVKHWLTIEDGADRLSRNICMELPFYTE